MRILFVQPDSKSATGYKQFGFIEPLALETIAACVQNHEVNILDMRVNPHLEEVLDDFQPDIVGTTAYTVEVYDAQRILQKVKKAKPNTFTVIGGWHATLVPNDFQKSFVDVIVTGEGESTFQELVAAFETGESLQKVKGIWFRQNGHWVYSLPRPPIQNLDNFPFPLRLLTKEYHNQYHWGSWRPCFWLETSRGCPYRCNFCSVWKFYKGKCAMRSAERVVREIETIPAEYIVFADDNFLQSVKRARKICELLKERGICKIFSMQARADTIVNNPILIQEWAAVGLKEMRVGFESFRNSDLEQFNKKSSVEINEQALEILHNNNMDVIGEFIVDVNYTAEDFNSLAQYVEKLDIAVSQFTILTPLPGTDLYEQRSNELLTHNYELFDLLHVVLPTKLPKEEFERRFVQLYKKVYFSPKSIWKSILRDFRSGELSVSRLLSASSELSGIRRLIKDLQG